MLFKARQGKGLRTAVGGIRSAVLPMLCAVAAGCTDTPATVRLEVYSWWTERSEQEAFEAVRQIHRETYQNVEIENLGADEAPDARQEMGARILAGAPPATFLANIGADVLSWTMVDTQKDPPRHALVDPVETSRRIHGLSDLFERSGLNDQLREGLKQDLVVGSGTAPFAVPINVHRLNVIYANRDALAEFSSREGNDGRTFLDLDTLCPEGDYDPNDPALDLDLDIAIGGGKHPWTLVLLTFENVLPALVARAYDYDAERVRDFYNALFRGQDHAARDPGTASEFVREALECVQYLSRWFRRDDSANRLWDENVGWAEAVNAVRDGAALTVMGDWASGLLAETLNDPSESAVVVSRPFPGTDGLFVYTSDTFPFPFGTEHPPEAEAFLETVASPRAQRAFSAKKGSIPARYDGDAESLSDWQREAAEAFETLPRVNATSGLFPPYYPQGDLADKIRLMTEWEVVRPGADEATRRLRLEEALRAFTDAEPLLAYWQDRIAEGAAEPP